MFDNSIKFKYTWRPYQEKTLKYVQKYIDDGKVNIVAAPGAGKTILGLELARYLKNPVIIFAPTVTIKNQWVDRFISSFTDYKEVPDWISTNIYDIKFFNVVTYQALHYAYKKRKNNENDDETDDVIEDNQTEEISNDIIKQYDIVEELKDKKIKTIVLDEAHHLKSQWWDSLNQVLNQLENVKTISLTATPPYDSEYTEWKKYISLCGEVDAEISVPELVKADNLCPHQDYIYFSSPTKEEKVQIKKYEDDIKQLIENIKYDENFKNAIKSHKYIKSPYEYEEELLDNVEYYSSMLIYLNSVNEKIVKDNLSILGDETKIPDLDIEWFEILLKNVIITDRKNYSDFEETIFSIEKKLNNLGILENKNISFTDNKTLQKNILNSIGKINSISQILKLERESLKEKLRMVVLADFIRKEFLNDSEMEINKIGVIPIFKKLTQDYPDVNMAILTGTIFVIPKILEKNLYGLCYENDVDVNKLEFEPLSINQNYSIVKIPNSMRNKVMSLISKMFSNGQINVIIGTKSLLGEGWDEPSINTLVLASFVGSFMLSNQMRGRAIRTWKKDSNKTSNIWHLVCVTDTDSEDEYIANSDFNMLKRRFKSFVGIDYEGKIISNGLDRLGNIKEPFTNEKISIYNSQMQQNANNRQEMYNSWKKALEKKNDNVEMVNELIIEKEAKTFKITKKLPRMLSWINIYFFNRFKKLLKELGYVTLNSLCDCNFIKTKKSKIELKVNEIRINNSNCMSYSCFITGATVKESNLFIDSLEEVVSKVANQRYIILGLNKKSKIMNEYYNVPSVLSVNKENAQVFSNYWQKQIGNHKLIYTRTSEGRKTLLKIRMKNMSYKDKKFKKQEIYFK